jgi:hypothetical protein
MGQVQPGSNTPDDTQNAAGWMVYAIVSSIVVGLGIIALVAVGIVPRLLGSDSGANSPDGPYRTRVRPVPNPADLYQLFPQYLGDFTAIRWEGTLDAGFTVQYGQADALITVSGRRAVSVYAAFFQVEEISKRNGPGNTAERILPGFFSDSHYLNVRDGEVRFAWSRDRWFFEVRTSSLDVLNRFMAVFAY